MSEPREIRNKRVALDAIRVLEETVESMPRGALMRVQLAERVDEFHRRWVDRGVLWTRPSVRPFDLDTWLPADEMAELADVTHRTVRSWCYRGHITSVPDDDGRPLYNVGEVLRYQARRAQTKAASP